MLVRSQSHPSPHSARAALERQVRREAALTAFPDHDGMTLQKDMESLFLPAEQAKATVVMLHGYTAGPWQYEEMAEFFQDKGYNVYVPRLPGHGWVSSQGVPTGERLLESNQDGGYDAFVDRVYDDAASLGAPVEVIGLSGGATLALRMAERHPQVEGVAAVAPFVGGNPPLGFLFPVVNFLDTITFGLLGNLLDHVPFGKNSLESDNGGPHTKGSMGQALSMYQVGKRIKTVQPPVQFITTAGDSLAGSVPVSRLQQRCGGQEETGWYHFPKAEGVRHAMVSPRQSPAAEQVRDLLFEFVDTGRLLERP